MAHLKKLQTEIDKGLKKVDEGVEEYNRLKDAHHRASQPNQKEKLEENLKAQIKKLQRDRNQLSSWIAEKSVKDKDLLMEGKSKIEALMDHFKDFERESKMKRFSQVGLNKEDRADPEVQKRREMITWIQDMLSNLEKEFDELTAEDQRLTSRKPSKNSKEEANLAFTKRVLESHRWHMNKLEQLQRKLNNEDVNVESLETLKDSLTNYMDEGINQRTAEGFMDFNEAYDDFNLEEVEDYLATAQGACKAQGTQYLSAPTASGRETQGKGRIQTDCNESACTATCSPSAQPGFACDAKCRCSGCCTCGLPCTKSTYTKAANGSSTAPGPGATATSCACRPRRWHCAHRATTFPAAPSTRCSTRP